MKEKPYIVIFVSCLIMGFLDLILLLLHPFEGKNDELSDLMRLFVFLEACLCAVNTVHVALLMQKLPRSFYTMFWLIDFRLHPT